MWLRVICTWLWDQKRTLDPLELELEKALRSLTEELGTKLKSSARAACAPLLSLLSSPRITLLTPLSLRRRKLWRPLDTHLSPALAHRMAPVETTSDSMSYVVPATWPPQAAYSIPWYLTAWQGLHAHIIDIEAEALELEEVAHTRCIRAQICPILNLPKNMIKENY